MLIDDFMPAWDVRERHRLRVRAAPEQVYAAVQSTDFGSSAWVRAMLWLRAFPAALAGGRGALRAFRERAPEPVTLAAFERQGFRVLGENAPHEMVIGLEGAFWKPRGDLRPVDALTFQRPVPPGVARAAWSFAVETDRAGACLLSTETRVVAGPGASVRFRLYWLLIRPGSGLIRRLMLRAIRARAESASE